MDISEPRPSAPGAAKVGRNDACPCGSGRKYKFCCGAARPAASSNTTSPTSLRNPLSLSGEAVKARGAPAATGLRHHGPVPVFSRSRDRECDPGSAQAVIQRAANLLRASRYEEAIAPLQEAARLLPYNPSVLSDLGLACLRCRRPAEAIGWFRRSLALRPSFGRTHHHLATALEQTGDEEAALATYRRALALNPQLAEAHNRIAALMLVKGKRREAAEAYDRASAAARGTSFGRLCRVNALMARDQMNEAADQLRRLIAQEPANSDAHRLLGNLLAEEGRFDEAATSIARSFALAPRQVSGYDGLVLSRRLTNADRPLVARMLARLEEGDLTEIDRMNLDFAVGKALDDLGDYAGAMRHFDAANRVRHSLSRFPRSLFAQRINRLIGRFTGEFFAANRAIGRDDETPVLVLGMPRSGTTLTERIISSHSRVGGGGELDFWNEHGPAGVEAETDWLAAAADRLYWDYRRLLLSVAPDALRVTDKMPFNFLWLGLIHLIFPNARIIHCRLFNVTASTEIYTNQFTMRWDFASDRGDLAFYYRQYLRLMDHWRRVLPPERLLEVEYEDMTADTEGIARRLVGFCGLDWDPACLEPEHNRDRVRTASMWQARQPIYRHSVERWRNYEPWLGELRQLLPG